MNKELEKKYDIHTIIKFNWWWYKRLGNKKIKSSYSDFLDFLKEQNKDE
jgi:hypothetical protein